MIIIIIICDFLHVFPLFNESVTEQKPISTSANKMENSHGNILVKWLQQLTVLWRDFDLHL